MSNSRAKGLKKERICSSIRLYTVTTCTGLVLPSPYLDLYPYICLENTTNIIRRTKCTVATTDWVSAPICIYNKVEQYSSRQLARLSWLPVTHPPSQLSVFRLRSSGQNRVQWGRMRPDSLRCCIWLACRCCSRAVWKKTDRQTDRQPILL